jgi:outer membrane protein assembly factor BamB/ankyrin repeat protein
MPGTFLVALALCAALLHPGQARAQFREGMAAIMGKGGTVERTSTIPYAKELAARLAKGQPRPAWEVPFPEEGADFIQFLDAKRVLLGTVEVGAYLGVPDYKKVLLLEASSGAKIWEAERRKLAPRGRYSLLALRPVIVLLGTDALSASVSGLDPASGKKLWEHTLGKPLAHVSASDSSRAYVLVEQGGGAQLAAIDLRSGARIWARELAGVAAKGRKPILQVDADSIYVVGQKLVRLTLDGAVAWSAEPPEIAQGTAAPLPGGVLAWASKSIALVDKASGQVRWRHGVERGGIKLAAFREGRILYVARTSEASDSVAALDAQSGAVQWLRQAGGTIVSALATDRGRVLFTLDNFVAGLHASSGEEAFRRRLPLTFAAASPTNYTPSGQPDLLEVRDGKLYLARESAGIAAYSTDGAELWRQHLYTLAPTVYPHSLPGRVRFMTTVLSFHNYPMRTGHVADGYLAGSTPNASMQYSQWRYDSLEQTRQSAVARRDYQRAEFYSGLQGAELRMQAFNQQMAVSQQIMGSAVALAGAIDQALKQTAVQGFINKCNMEIDNAVPLHYGAFQGRYYVRPFLDGLQQQASGVTVVDLETGKRSDFVTSPFIGPLADNTVSMPQITFDPENGRLVTVAVGLEPQRYVEYVAWYMRVPRPSVLAYDVAALPFSEKNPVVEERAASAWPVREDFIEAARTGDLARMRRLLEAGLGPDAQNPRTSSTALMEAAHRNQEGAVRLLIERGANVNAVFQARIGGEVRQITALDETKDARVRELLLKAGAKRGVDMPPPPADPDADTKRKAALAEQAKSWKPYMLAVWAGMGNVESLTIMLDGGTSPNEKNLAGETAVMQAAKNGHLGTLDILIKRGADVNAVSLKRQTALDLAKDEQTRSKLREAGALPASQVKR